MKIRLASDLQPDSIVDGAGIRTVIWTQGCPHHCLGCHNPKTHSFQQGALVDVEDVKEALLEIENQDGVTFSGGEPMCQPEACAILARFAKEQGLNIWCYTGYTYEQLLKLSDKNSAIMDFLKEIDVLIDGKFQLDQKSLNLKFKGSRNQRILDVQKSLETNRVYLIPEYQDEINFSSTIKMEEGVYI